MKNSVDRNQMGKLMVKQSKELVKLRKPLPDDDQAEDCAEEVTVELPDDDQSEDQPELQ